MLVYASKTQNVARFIKKLKYTDILEVKTGSELVNQPFILVTYTTGFGEVPQEVADFLAQNHQLLRGVCASGNRNWGANFAKAGTIIAQRYQVPLIHRFELAGLKQDIQIFEEGVDQIGLFREE